MKAIHLKIVILAFGIAFLASGSMSYAQTLSVTFTRTQSAVRTNAVDVYVQWTDASANTNTGYHYTVNTGTAFVTTKRNAEPQTPIKTRECRIQGLDAAAKYYIHIAPVDNRGTILKTESFKLFQ